MLFAHRHAALSAQPWWQFAWQAEASRSARALVGALGLFVLVALHRLPRPPRPEVLPPAGTEFERARPIVEACTWTCANLVYRGDKARLLLTPLGKEARVDLACLWLFIRSPDSVADGFDNPSVPNQKRMNNLSERHT